jgi:hypothetical protein
MKRLEVGFVVSFALPPPQIASFDFREASNRQTTSPPHPLTLVQSTSVPLLPSPALASSPFTSSSSSTTTQAQAPPPSSHSLLLPLSRCSTAQIALPRPPTLHGAWHFLNTTTNISSNSRDSSRGNRISRLVRPLVLTFQRAIEGKFIGSDARGTTSLSRLEGAARVRRARRRCSSYYDGVQGRSQSRE